jgi:hypothetical protein
VWAHSVVVGAPGIEHAAGVGQRQKQRLVEALIAQPAYEALHEGALRRLARRDVVPGNSARLAPLQHRYAGQLRSQRRHKWAGMTITALESAATSTTTFNGGEDDMVLSARNDGARQVSNSPFSVREIN